MLSRWGLGALLLVGCNSVLGNGTPYLLPPDGGAGTIGDTTDSGGAGAGVAAGSVGISGMPEATNSGAGEQNDGDGQSSAGASSAGADTADSGAPKPVCGNGALEAAEQCDDGNSVAGDGCAACVVEKGFTCDGGSPSRCVDIDECSSETPPCDANANCKNVPGSYTCTCNPAYEGDGSSCTEKCTPAKCPHGCCDATGTCQTTLSDAQCGTNGASCGVCSGTNHCVDGQCGCASSADCPLDQACDLSAHTCSNACSASATCNGGCCNATSKLCVSGSADALCGVTGVICTDCTKLSATPVCEAGGACGTCKPDATGCSGTTPRTCGSNGKWINGAIKAGECSALCTPGTPGPCTGTTPQTCNVTGDAWLRGTVSVGTCSAICTPGTSGPCSGTAPQTCNSTGSGWLRGTVTAGTCGATCSPGVDTRACNPAPACNPSTITCTSLGQFPACPAPQNPTWNGLNLGAACSSGKGACATSGTVVCETATTATCNNPPPSNGAPTSFQSTPAVNGSWDWDCDGLIEYQYGNDPGQAVACNEVDICFGRTTPSSCNQNQSSNVALYFGNACSLTPAVCGISMWEQGCWWSSGKNSCQNGAGATVTEGCK